MHIEYFKYLLAIEECGSIRQAAELLHVKQQNLSTIVKNIESQYDVTIFDRSHKGVQITEDGAFFLKEIRAMMENLKHIESPYLYPSKQSYGQVVDTVNIYCTNVVGSRNLVNVIDQFREHFPYVKVKMLTKSRDEIVHLIQEEPKSLGIVLTASNVDKVASMMPEGIVAEPFVRMPVYAATAKDNLEAQQLNTISVQDLLQKKLVILSQNQEENTYVHDLLNQYGIPDIQYIVDNATVFLDLLQRKQLWSVCVSGQILHNSLLTIPFQEEFYIQAYLLYSEQVKDNFVMSSLLKILSDYSRK